MFLEVILDSGKSVYHPIKKDKLVIGSGLNCDIVIPGKEVSREHLVLTREAEKFYVSDLGSTNGTFLADKPLIQGEIVPLSPYQHLRLGKDVIITLVSSEEVKTEAAAPADLNLGRQDQTMIISREEMERARTEEVIKARQRQREASKEDRQRSKKLSLVNTLVVAGFALFAGWFIYNQQSKPPTAPRQQTIFQTPVGIKARPTRTYALAEFPSKPLSQIGNAYQFAVLADPYYEKAKALLASLPELRQDPKKGYSYQTRHQLCTVTALIFLKNGVANIKPDLDPAKNLEFSLETQDYSAKCLLALTPSQLQKIREQLTDQKLEEVRTGGISAVSAFRERLTLSVF